MLYILKLSIFAENADYGAFLIGREVAVGNTIINYEKINYSFIYPPRRCCRSGIGSTSSCRVERHQWQDHQHSEVVERR